MIYEEVVEAMLVLNKSLTINQDWNHYTNTLLVKYNYVLTEKFRS